MAKAEQPSAAAYAVRLVVGGWLRVHGGRRSEVEAVGPRNCQKPRAGGWVRQLDGACAAAALAALEAVRLPVLLCAEG